MPFFGLAMGAAMGAPGGHFADYGIDDDFIDGVRDKATEGTSVLFLLSSDAVVDKVQDAFQDTKMDLIRSNLSAEQEAQPQEAIPRSHAPAWEWSLGRSASF